jgi:alanine dehydrogenase
VLLKAGCVAIAYEEMVDGKGRRPLLVPMSLLAGAGAMVVAAQYTQSKYGGCGKLFFRTEGAEPVVVVIIGAGTAGRAAAKAGLEAGAEVHLLEKNESMLAGLRETFPEAQVLPWSSQALEERLARLDVLVNCTMWMPGDPRLVTRAMLARVKRGSLIVDVSADPHGGIETSVETTHEDPIRIVDGVLHYCVQNIPSLFARTASQALSRATWPYLEKMVTLGLERAVRQEPILRRGVVIWRGSAFGEELARVQKIATGTAGDLLKKM